MATVKQVRKTRKKVKIAYVKKCKNCGKFVKKQVTPMKLKKKKTEYEYMCDELMLDKDYKKLLEMKIKGYSRTKMADELSVSVDTLDKMIQKLKKKIMKII